MNELEKRMISAGLKRNSESWFDYSEAKRLIKSENYDDAIAFIVEYLHV